MENSPARKSSLNRLKESVLDRFLGQSNNKKAAAQHQSSRADSTHGAGSDKGDPTLGGVPRAGTFVDNT
jgi:hypothetical protein